MGLSNVVAPNIQHLFSLYPIVYLTSTPKLSHSLELKSNRKSSTFKVNYCYCRYCYLWAARTLAQE